MIKNIIAKISDFFDTPFFSLALVVIELGCYFLSLDLAIIIILSLCISFAFLFKHNLNCTLALFLFLSSMISLKNSPSGDSNGVQSLYYFQPQIYITCIVFASIPVLITIIKAVENLITKKVPFSPFIISALTFGLVVLMNGCFRNEYNPLDLMFGLFMFFFFVVLLIAIVPYVFIDKDSLLTISRQVSIYLLVPIVEIFVYYLGFIINGNLITTRLDVFVGWGNRNTLGMLFTVMLPFIFYLIKKEESKIFKSLAISLLVIVLSCIALCFSIQAYIFVFFLLVIYLFFLFKTSENKNKKIFGIASGLLLFVGFSLFFAGYLTGKIDVFGFSSTKSRFDLWTDALDSFANFPMFGGGFFFLGGDPEIELYSIMPYCCHNTFFELLGACGLFGLIAYAFYRFASFKRIFSDLTIEKFYPFLALCLIILMSLFDIHLFDFFGSALYTVLLCLSMAKTSKYKEETNCNLQLEENSQ